MKKTYEFLGNEYDLEAVNEKVNEALASINELNENLMAQIKETMKKIEAENKDYQNEEIEPTIKDIQMLQKRFIKAKIAQSAKRQQEIIDSRDYPQLLKDIEESVNLAPTLSAEFEKMMTVLASPDISAKVKMAQLEMQLDTFLYTESTVKVQKDFNNTYYFDNMFNDEIDDFDENDYE